MGGCECRVALKPEAWTQEGDGVRFMAGVSDGRASDELFVQDLNPFVNQSDRRWIPVMVDLSAYAGEEVDIILNTYGSAARQARGRAQRPGGLGSAGDCHPVRVAVSHGSLPAADAHDGSNHRCRCSISRPSTGRSATRCSPPSPASATASGSSRARSRGARARARGRRSASPTPSASRRAPTRCSSR